MIRIEGPAYVISGEVDTDTIIKSRHCTTADGARLAPHCLAELAQQPPFAAGGPWPVVVCGATFGVGSARFHAPLALAAAGVRAVVAPAFGAIFFENCLNGGYLLPLRAPLEPLPATGTAVSLTVDGGVLRITADGVAWEGPCTLPAWALAGRPWIELIAEQAQAAGGLEALRRRGLRLD